MAPEAECRPGRGGIPDDARGGGNVGNIVPAATVSGLDPAEALRRHGGSSPALDVV
jgi:hypothetical protein